MLKEKYLILKGMLLGAKGKEESAHKPLKQNEIYRSTFDNTYQMKLKVLRNDLPIIEQKRDRI